MQTQIKKNRNLVGIIPISGREEKLNLPWPDCLQPIGEELLAIERSVYECALMSCNSIWIICNDDCSPVIRKRIGDYVLNPKIFDSWNYKKTPNDSKEYIPIFYTPVLQKDRNRRDTLGWSILHGALTSFIVSSKISKWCLPSNYFVSFPYGLYDPRLIKDYREDVRSGKRCYGVYQGKTVRDNMYLPFSFLPEDWIILKKSLEDMNSGGSRNLPLSERWSARNFTLDKIFKNDNIEIEKEMKVQEYYDLDSWQQLREFYSSNLVLKSIPKSVAKPHFINLE